MDMRYAVYITLYNTDPDVDEVRRASIVGWCESMDELRTFLKCFDDSAVLHTDDAEHYVVVYANDRYLESFGIDFDCRLLQTFSDETGEIEFYIPFSGPYKLIPNE